MYEIMQKVYVMKLLQLADLLITLQLTTHDLNMIALEMYSYHHNWSSYTQQRYSHANLLGYMKLVMFKISHMQIDDTL